MKRLLLFLAFVCGAASAANYPTAPMPYQVLDTTKIVSVKIGEAVTTTAPTYAIAYQDVTETSTTAGYADGSFTTSFASACAAPAQGTRQISSITICNIDTVSHTIYVQKAASGTPATATAVLLNAYTLAANATVILTVNGPQTSVPLALPVTVPNGGTGDTTLTNHGVMLGQGTAAVVVTAAGTAGVPLTSGGASADPSFAALNLGTAAAITGILPPGNGGSGVANIKNLTWNNSLTLSGTDSTTMTFPSTSATIARTDAGQTFTGASTATSWNLVTPLLGTPASGTLTNCTGLPLTTGVTGLLPLANGGSNANLTAVNGGLVWCNATQMQISSALTQNGPLYGGGAGAAPSAMAAGTNGQIIVGQTGAAPLWRTTSGDATINSGGQITVTSVNGGVGTNNYFLKTSSGTLTWAQPTTYSLQTSDPAPTTIGMNLTFYDCDVSSGAFNLTLPSIGSATFTGVVIWIRLAKQDTAGANVLTIKPNAADGINGMGVNLPLYLTWEGECVCLCCTGVVGGGKGQGWNIIDYTGAPNTLNMAYNGHGIIAQRSDGSSNVSGTYGYGTCDRWKSAVNGTSITHTFTQDTNPNGTISNFSQSNYAMKQTVTVTSGTVTFRQFIEAKDALALQNKVAIFSCRVAHDFGSSVNFQLNLYPMASADSGTIGTVLSGGNIGVNVSVATATATTLTTAPVKMGSNMTLGAVLEVVMNTSSTVTSKHIWLGDVVFQPGTANLRTAERSQQQELARCQRYFTSTFPMGTAPVTAAGLGGALCTICPSASGNYGVNFILPCHMRIAPAFTFYNPSSANGKWRNVSAAADGDNPTVISAAGDNSVFIYNSGATAGANQVLAIHVSADADF